MVLPPTSSITPLTDLAEHAQPFQLAQKTYLLRGSHTQGPDGNEAQAVVQIRHTQLGCVCSSCHGCQHTQPQQSTSWLPRDVPLLLSLPAGSLCPLLGVPKLVVALVQALPGASKM